MEGLTFVKQSIIRATRYVFFRLFIKFLKRIRKLRNYDFNLDSVGKYEETKTFYGVRNNTVDEGKFALR